MLQKAAPAFAVALVLAAAGCHRQPAPAPAAKPAAAAGSPAVAPAGTSPAPPAAASPSSAQKALSLHGVVHDVDASLGALSVSNDDVPGWGMPQMTMTYHVSNPDVLKSLKAGDQVTADVYAGDFAKLYNVRLAAAAPAASTKAADDAMPPLSYVCPSQGEENEINDRPGTCEKSSAKLVPVRLTIAYECLKGPAYIQSKPGVCRYDKSDLAPITASVFWACGDTRFLQPGACGNGNAREERFEKRPHGDHNPRHGGPYVAMSADLLHHAEGTLTASGVFRAYFYDEYTRPMPVARYAARVAPTDSNAKESGPAAPMHAVKSLGINVLETRIPGAAVPSKDAPLHFKLHVQVTPGAKDWTSDWDFVRYSVEPGIPPVNPPATVVAAATPPPAIAPAATPPAIASTANANANASAGGGGAELSASGPPPQEPIPGTTAGVLQELKTHTAAVAEQLSEGNLGGLWLDALRAKDLAIALESAHAGDVAPAKRPDLEHAARILTETAWQIDAAGDLGQGDQIAALQKTFAGAAAQIESLYGQTNQ